MATPIGPSLRLLLVLAEALTEVSSACAREVWDRWLGSRRFHRKLASLEHAGWLTLSPAGQSVDRVVRLTDAGRRAALGGLDPEERWQRTWDGRWRLILFDVPETNRALRSRLRREMRELRFGYLQNSVWITPDSIESLHRSIGGAEVNVETLALMEATPCGEETDADLVLGAWDFARVNRAYENHAKLLGMGSTRLMSQAARENWLSVEWRAWMTAVRFDPFLPEALLPPGYRGREAWQERARMLRQAIHPG